MSSYGPASVSEPDQSQPSAPVRYVAGEMTLLGVFVKAIGYCTEESCGGQLINFIAVASGLGHRCVCTLASLEWAP